MAVDFPMVPHTALSDPLQIFEFDFEQLEEFVPETKQFTLEVTNTGMLNAIVMWWIWYRNLHFLVHHFTYFIAMWTLIYHFLLVLKRIHIGDKAWYYF